MQCKAEGETFNIILILLYHEYSDDINDNIMGYILLFFFVVKLQNLFSLICGNNCIILVQWISEYILMKLIIL